MKALKAFTQFGLPKLIIVDDDNKFKGYFKSLFERLLIPVIAVAKENHKALRNERFHRFLNKVQRINTASTGQFERWLQGVFFAVYAWNAGPIDGTDIPRSVVAIGREFPPPIDIRPPSHNPAETPSEGHDAIDHFEAISPLLYRLRALNKILIEERRRRHRELKNEGKKQRSFRPGDIVIVRRQVQSVEADGISAKLQLRWRGPYLVVRPSTEAGTSYVIRRIPFCSALGRTLGNELKVATSKMERLPSTLVLPRPIDGTDTRFASMSGPLAQHPLERSLRVTKPGTYRQAPAGSLFAYEPVADIWGEDPTLRDDDDADSNDDVTNAPPDTDDAAASSDASEETVKISNTTTRNGRKRKGRHAPGELRLSHPEQPRYQLGQRIAKHFPGYPGKFQGSVSRLPRTKWPYYRIHYDDDDEEDIHADLLHQFIADEDTSINATSAHLSSASSASSVSASFPASSAASAPSTKFGEHATSPPPPVDRVTAQPIANDNENHRQEHRSLDRSGNNYIRQRSDKTTKAALSRLRRSIDDSSGKLFFVKFKPDGAPLTWLLVQVDPSQCRRTAMNDHGVYFCRFYVASPEDITSRKLFECRFWPEIWTTTVDGDPLHQRPVRPNKAKEWLTANRSSHIWLGDEINLADCSLVGPFDFDHRRVLINNRSKPSLNHINEIHWKELERRCTDEGIDASSIREFSPRRPRPSSEQRSNTTDHAS